MEKTETLELITLDVKGATALDNGMMRYPATLTRAGVFKYINPDGTTFHQLRTPEEVFDPESMASFESVPLTNEHPYKEGGAVTAENATRVTVGTVSGVHRAGRKLNATVTVYDQATIDDIKAGKTQLSCGYFKKLEAKAGIVTDEAGRQHPYTHVQHTIRGNHVALVQVGRAGPEARLLLDSHASVLVTDESIENEKESPTMKTITLDSTPVEMNETTAAVVTKAIDSRDARIKELETAQAKAKTDLDTQKATLDSANADLKDLRDPAKFEAAVEARSALHTSARQILGADTKFTGMTTRAIKEAVVKKLRPSLSCDGTEDYVNGLFAIACEDAKTGNIITKVVEGQMKNGEAKTVTTNTTDAVDEDEIRNAPMKKMMAEFLNPTKK